MGSRRPRRSNKNKRVPGGEHSRRGSVARSQPAALNRQGRENNETRSLAGSGFLHVQNKTSTKRLVRVTPLPIRLMTQMVAQPRPTLAFGHVGHAPGRGGHRTSTSPPGHGIRQSNRRQPHEQRSERHQRQPDVADAMGRDDVEIVQDRPERSRLSQLLDRRIAMLVAFFDEHNGNVILDGILAAAALLLAHKQVSLTSKSRPGSGPCRRPGPLTHAGSARFPKGQD